MTPTYNRRDSHYHAHIDGLRAIAVLGVLLFHAHLGFRGGYVGVDVFFTISGYLITGLILKDLDRGQFHIVEFWERRIRRILPAVAVVTLATLVAGWFMFFPLDFRELGQSACAQTLLASNIYFFRETGYFAQGIDEVMPLLHTWSLAVEEQFYLIFPLLLLAISRLGRTYMRSTLLTICIASFGVCVYASYSHPTGNFYLLPTRAWELLIGSLLSVVPAQGALKRWQAELASYGGLLAILYAMLYFDHDTRFPGVAALLPCIGTAAIIRAQGPSPTSLGRFLSLRPLVFIGLISYSLYLWHWPILVFVRYGTVGTLSQHQSILLLLASAVMASLSWRFIETPFRTRTLFKNRVSIFSFACLTTLAVFLAGFGIHKANGFPSRIPTEAKAYADGRLDWSFRNDLSLADIMHGNWVELGAGNKQLPIKLVVWGDSHAMAVMPVLDALCKEHGVRGVAATHSLTVPLTGYESKGRLSMERNSLAFNQAVVDFILSNHVDNVVLAAHWNLYIAADQGATRLGNSLLATTRMLHDAGVRVWILKQVPEYTWDVPHALSSAVLHGRDPTRLGLPLADYRAASRMEDSMFSACTTEIPGVMILDPTTLLVGPTDLCRVANKGQALYCDKDHLSIAGAMELRPLFEPIVGATH